MRVLDYARGTRERLGIKATDFDIGAMLHRDIPFLASVAGAPIHDSERSDNPHLAGTVSRDRCIAECARHILRSTSLAAGMPDNGLLSDPAKGNVAALLVDRIARLAGVDRIDDDGPRDALAAHMISAGMKVGAGLITEWSPGWPQAHVDPASDVKAYTRRSYALDDRQLAAELLDHARDARTRLRVDDDGSPQATALWQAVPAMALMFGSRLEPHEGDRFALLVRGMDDQDSFSVASTMVSSALDDGTFLQDKKATIGERSLFAAVETGSSMVVLLDRTARALDADRAGPDDPTGSLVMRLRLELGLSADAVWHPSDPTRRMHNASLAAQASRGF